MRGPYPGELRMRVVSFVEAGGSRREAAEQFDIGVSSAIRWMQRFREDGTCEPMPRGGSTSPLEEYAQQILALNRERPDFTLDEIVLVLISNNVSPLRSGGGTSSSSTTSPSTRLLAWRRQSRPAVQNCDTCRSIRRTSIQLNWYSIPSRRCCARRPSAQSTGCSDAFAPSFEDSSLPNAQAILGTPAVIHYDRDVL